MTAFWIGLGIIFTLLVWLFVWALCRISAISEQRLGYKE